jgi:hypothetical protein
MSGAEFRALQARAGLSVRAAAYLKVSPSTLQRWRSAPDERSPIPAWAVTLLEAEAKRAQHAREYAEG